MQRAKCPAYTPSFNEAGALTPRIPALVQSAQTFVVALQ